MTRKAYWKKFILLATSLIILMIVDVSVGRIPSLRSWSEFNYINRSNMIKDDPELLWRIKPMLDITVIGFHVRTNDIGLRCNDTCISGEALKRSPKYKILCLGGSVTFGWNLDNEFTYPALLEKELNRRYPGDGFIVINAGVMGYTTSQAKRFLKNRLAFLHPDLITVCFSINDQQPTPNPPDEILIAQQHNLIQKTKRLLNFSGLYKFMRKIFLKHRFRRSDTPAAPNGYQSVRVPLETYRKNLDELYSIACDLHAKIAFITEKITTATSEPDTYQAAMRDRAAAHDIPYIDIAGKFNEIMESGRWKELSGHYPEEKNNERKLPKYGKYKNKQKALVRNIIPSKRFDPLFTDDFHPNITGNRWIARWLADDLSRIIRLPEPPP